MIKYKRGIASNMSERTWELLSPEKKAQYTDYDETNPKELSDNTIEIKLEPETPEEIQDRIKKLELEIEVLRSKLPIDDKKKVVAIVQDADVEEFDPYKLELEPLKEFLTSHEIKFDKRIKNIEKLQNLIP